MGVRKKGSVTAENKKVKKEKEHGWSCARTDKSGKQDEKEKKLWRRRRDVIEETRLRNRDV